MNPNPLHLVLGTDFDASAANIRVRADRAEATVFDVPANQLKCGIVRVLAHDEASAKAAAIEFIQNAQEEAARLELQ